MLHEVLYKDKLTLSLFSTKSSLTWNYLRRTTVQRKLSREMEMSFSYHYKNSNICRILSVESFSYNLP